MIEVPLHRNDRAHLKDGLLFYLDLLLALGRHLITDY